ncbi:hypothetical protein [Flectobacillus roseus]|uniref:Uncharacterized protein n=1 Tax=Flectobacillus roseus TaxID=502259 RepID=A0ABT6Y230_9BACT|nr:hypothetical protein [Flectobacillus roseus]MDI9857620.1 hypothetical protein [Flectobacillus roseus]
MKHYPIAILLLATSYLSYGQSKKEVKKNKIKTVTEQITESIGGKEVTRNDGYKKFNKQGEVIEEAEYDKSGKLKRKVLSKYNEFDDKIEEVIVDGNNHQIEREVYKYDSFKEKSEVLHYNEHNELDCRSVYSINGNGLKTEKKTYDAKGKLIQVKKYTYGF